MTNLEIILTTLLSIYVFMTFVSVLVYMRDQTKHPFIYSFLLTIFTPIIIWYILYAILKGVRTRAKSN